eukprot:scaffold361_cov248-Pinguiococcus_pyrenoidosus.AAC.15
MLIDGAYVVVFKVSAADTEAGVAAGCVGHEAPDKVAGPVVDPGQDIDVGVIDADADGAAEACGPENGPWPREGPVDGMSVLLRRRSRDKAASLSGSLSAAWEPFRSQRRRWHGPTTTRGLSHTGPRRREHPRVAWYVAARSLMALARRRVRHPRWCPSRLSCPWGSRWNVSGAKRTLRPSFPGGCPGASGVQRGGSDVTRDRLLDGKDMKVHLGDREPLSGDPVRAASNSGIDGLSITPGDATVPFILDAAEFESLFRVSLRRFPNPRTVLENEHFGSGC